MSQEVDERAQLGRARLSLIKKPPVVFSEHTWFRNNAQQLEEVKS